MTDNKIIIGANINSPLFQFDNSQIVSITGQLSTDLIADSLSIDRLDPICYQKYLVQRIFKPTDYSAIRTADGKILCGHWTDDPEKIPYGTPLSYYHGGNLFARMYVEGAARKTKNTWQISAMSLIGIFDKQEHSGGVFFGETFANIVADIFGGTAGTASGGMVTVSGGVEAVKISERLAAVKCYGWLPYATKRENLHQLLFATGASLSRDSGYNIIFDFLSDLTSAEIEDGRIYMEGGTNSTAGVTGVEVTEHTFQWVPGNDEIELYNNTDVYTSAADQVKVIFSEPVKVDTVRADGGLSIVDVGANFAIVSGKGTLHGVPYVHLTRLVSKHKETTAPPNIKTVTGATLISPLNSEAVTARLFDFYTESKKITGAVVSQGERPGNQYDLKNAFGEPVTAIMTDMSVNVSGIIKGSFEAVAGFTLRHVGNNYNTNNFFTTQTTWIVPQSIRQSDFPFVRFAMVSGGAGGQGGEGGQQGRGCFFDSNDGTYKGTGSGPGGVGGPGGLGGSGGRVLAVARLNVENVNKLVFSPGAGGKGGAGGRGGYNDTTADYTAAGDGQPGTDSTLTLYNDDGGIIAVYSTASGSILPFGVADVTRNTVFGLAGVAGTSGANGGEGGVASPGADGLPGGDVGQWKGGAGSPAGYAAHNDGQGMMEAMAGGAGGGGAAKGANGADAISPGMASYQQYVWGGNAGNGASATPGPTTPSIYGQGGDGGDGGGGGGSGGAQNWTPITSGVKDGTPGSGGNGTAGADGAGGCMFLYSA